MRVACEGPGSFGGQGAWGDWVARVARVARELEGTGWLGWPEARLATGHGGGMTPCV